MNATRNLMMACAVILALCGGADAMAQTTAAIPMFDTGAPTTGVQVAKPWVTRAQTMRLNPALKTAPSATPAQGLASQSRIGFTPFPNNAITLRRTAVVQRGPASFVWKGVVDGQPMTRALFVVTQGRVAGNIETSSKSFAVRTRPDGSLVVIEVDVPKLPNEGQPLSRVRTSTHRKLTPDICPKVLLTPAEPVHIDVLVAYTAQAETEASGYSNIDDEIALAIEDTNAAYEASDINQRIYLAGTKKYDYAETTYEADVDRFAGSSDGYMDDIHALRDAKAADAVVLMVSNTWYCGLADGIMDAPSEAFESDAFAAVAVSCATWNHSFAHELGHLMGARHDTYMDPSGTAYAHGFVDPANHFRTVMAYNNACAAAQAYCVRWGVFSGPNVTVDGHAAGSATSQDNVRRLTDSALVVSRFRLSDADKAAANRYSCNPPSPFLPVPRTPRPAK